MAPEELKDLEQMVSKVDKVSVAAQLLEAMPLPIVVADENGKIVIFNSKAAFLTGYMPSEVIGNSVELLLPIRFRDQYSQGFMQESEPKAMEVLLFLLDKKGNEISVSITWNAAMTEIGRLAVTIIQNRSEPTSGLNER